MGEQEPDILTDHNYDGIQEYDNPTPGWWTWIFAVTVVLSPIYFLVVLAGRGVLSPTGEYERAVVANLERQFAQIGELKPDEQTIVTFATKEKWMGVARKLYIGKCVSCHGAKGQGLVGPNLTDHHYLNVENVEQIVGVIANGANQGAMPAWKNQLHPNEIVLLASYVVSLRGQNESGREPEGQIIDPWPEVVPSGAEESESTKPNQNPARAP